MENSEESFKELCKRLSLVDGVEGMMLGGSRATGRYDKNSDYDLYVYCSVIPEKEKRYEAIEPCCSYIELNNMFFEIEDDCTLKGGTDIDIIYRDINGFERDLKSVVFECNAHNAYTTGLWFTLVKSTILSDKSGKVKALFDKFNVTYPKTLKKNIIKKGLCLLSGHLPSYDRQILKAHKRGDFISVNHRITAFVETYFDVLFALNSTLHPGEKRMIEYAKHLEHTPLLFEEDLHELIYAGLSDDHSGLEKVLEHLFNELSKITH